MIRMEYELMRSVAFIEASRASSTTTWLTLPLASFYQVVMKTELVPLLGDGLVDGIRWGVIAVWVTHEHSGPFLHN
jgi:hypothetical protein